MSELDPNILKRNLPEDIHAAIDQVNSNVESAVKDLVNGFKNYANEVAEQFERKQFSQELQGKIDMIKADLNADLERVQKAGDGLAELAKEALTKAQAANQPGLTSSISAIIEESQALKDKLAAFREKSNTLAEKTGGLIAKAAIKTFTGGIG